MRRGAKDYRSDCHFNAICDVCGFKFKGSELRLRWDNLRVCNDDYEQRHPQDFIKGKIDRQVPPFVRPPPVDLVDVIIGSGGALINESTGEEITP